MPRALSAPQAADRALRQVDAASDRSPLAMPYWGWEVGVMNGQLLPAIVRQRFSVLRPDLVEDPKWVVRHVAVHCLAGV